jgi:threonine aldolase
MRRAMAEAELGDDVFGDDPTVNALEERAAELLGKEAGLFVASGTMGNLVAQMAHLARGQETIAGREHHMVIDEAAGHAVIVGASMRALDDRPDGTLDPAEIEAAFRDPTDPHEPITGLITLENTHAHSMGQPLTPEYTREVAAIARAHDVPLHIDGARIWNAVVALDVSPTDLADPADTVTFCLSKALACPRTMRTPGVWPRRCPSSTVSSRPAGPLSRHLGRWIPAACERTSSSSRSSATEPCFSRPSEHETSRWWNIPTGKCEP